MHVAKFDAETVELLREGMVRRPRRGKVDAGKVNPRQGRKRPAFEREVADGLDGGLEKR